MMTLTETWFTPTGFPHFLKSHGEQLFSKAKLVLSSDGSIPQDHGKMQLSTRGYESSRAKCFLTSKVSIVSN